MKKGHIFTVTDGIAKCDKCGYTVNLDHAKKAGVYLEDLYALKCAWDFYEDNF